MSAIQRAIAANTGLNRQGNRTTAAQNTALARGLARRAKRGLQTVSLKNS